MPYLQSSSTIDVLLVLSRLRSIYVIRGLLPIFQVFAYPTHYNTKSTYQNVSLPKKILLFPWEALQHHALLPNHSFHGLHILILAALMVVFDMAIRQSLQRKDLAGFH